MGNSGFSSCLFWRTCSSMFNGPVCKCWCFRCQVNAKYNRAYWSTMSPCLQIGQLFLQQLFWSLKQHLSGHFLHSISMHFWSLLGKKSSPLQVATGTRASTIHTIAKETLAAACSSLIATVSRIRDHQLNYAFPYGFWSLKQNSSFVLTLGQLCRTLGVALLRLGQLLRRPAQVLVRKI